MSSTDIIDFLYINQTLIVGIPILRLYMLLRRHTHIDSFISKREGKEDSTGHKTSTFWTKIKTYNQVVIPHIRKREDRDCRVCQINRLFINFSHSLPSPRLPFIISPPFYTQSATLVTRNERKKRKSCKNSHWSTSTPFLEFNDMCLVSYTVCTTQYSKPTQGWV